MRTRATAALLTILLATFLSGPAAAAVRPPLDEPPPVETADLVSALADDGRFIGAAGMRGTIDASAWRLTSNLAVGEAPRFAPASQASTSSTLEWAAVGFEPAGTEDALNSIVLALAVWADDLYIGGQFTNAAGIPAADYVARWDGSTWSALGADVAGTDGALNSSVSALAVAGSDVYVGGSFSNAAGIAEADRVGRWDGSTWSALGSNGAGDGAISVQVLALAVDGSDVYVGGIFSNAAGIAEADRLARWDGSTWSALGSNGAGDGALSGSVNALAVAGSVLYAGGEFQNAAGIATADFVARWEGGNWSALGSIPAGTDGALNNVVLALAVNDVGDLYVGGGFTNAAGIATADKVARWDGTGWSPLGSNGSSNGVFAISSAVYSLAVVGSNVYIGGDFINAAGSAASDYVARWDGSSWSALGTNDAGTEGALDNTVYALAVDDGADLYVGGLFTNAADIGADHLARWNGSGWTPVGFGGSLNGSVQALAIVGRDLFVGGEFANVAGIATADYVARWDGTSWSALGSNGAGDGALNNLVVALAVEGNDVYVGGYFSDAAGIATADYVARWDGTSWSALGSNGAGDGGLNSWVDALAIGHSGELYVGGGFFNAAGITTADYVARWDGTSWSALGSNGAGDGALNQSVHALAVDDGGELYVGGDFFDAAGIATADNVARWDGSGWSALGSNGTGDGALNSQVFALAVAGSDIYVGGGFFDAAGIAAADYVARWDGSGWSALGSNPVRTNGALNSGSLVFELSVAGDDVYVGGIFTNAAGISTADHVARWDGSNWFALGSNSALNDGVVALAAVGADVYVGGLFLNASGIATADYLARYGRPDLEPCTTSPFTDVPVAHPFCAEINWMKEAEISIGFVDGTYRPSIAVTRQAMSAFMARLAGATLTSCSDAGLEPFSDVSADHPFCAEIAWMKDEGISIGFSDGTYRPSIAVTRQAMSAFMARLAGATSPPPCTTPPFNDVPIDHPFCAEIKWMANNGISIGFTDSTYRPTNAVTRQAMSAFMYRVSWLLP